MHDYFQRKPTKYKQFYFQTKLLIAVVSCLHLRDETWLGWGETPDRTVGDVQTIRSSCLDILSESDSQRGDSGSVTVRGGKECGCTFTFSHRTKTSTFSFQLSFEIYKSIQFVDNSIYLMNFKTYDPQSRDHLNELLIFEKSLLFPNHF